MRKETAIAPQSLRVKLPTVYPAHLSASSSYTDRVTFVLPAFPVEIETRSMAEHGERRDAFEK